MIIDAHAHLDRSAAFGWDDGPEDLLALMDDVGIDYAAVTTYGDEPGPTDSYDRLREWVAGSDRLVGLARIDPRYGDAALDALERAMTDDAMVGLKLHPISSVSHPGGDHTLALLDLAADLDVPVLVHSDDRPPATPRQIGRAAARTDATILLAHVGGYLRAREALAVAEANENVVLETSACPYPRVLADAIERLGAERVVYGSDMPPANPAVELAKIDVLDLPPDDRERVRCRNAAELYGLDVAGDGDATGDAAPDGHGGEST